jgi:hypothetical protein
VLFEPKSTKFWVANATAEKRPAAEQPYHAFQLSELLTRKPSSDAKVLEAPVDSPPREAAAAK